MNSLCFHLHVSRQADFCVSAARVLFVFTVSSCFFFHSHHLCETDTVFLFDSWTSDGFKHVPAFIFPPSHLLHSIHSQFLLSVVFSPPSFLSLLMFKTWEVMKLRNSSWWIFLLHVKAAVSFGEKMDKLKAKKKDLKRINDDVILILIYIPSWLSG